MKNFLCPQSQLLCPDMMQNKYILELMSVGCPDMRENMTLLWFTSARLFGHAENMNFLPIVSKQDFLLFRHSTRKNQIFRKNLSSWAREYAISFLINILAIFSLFTPFPSWSIFCNILLFQNFSFLINILQYILENLMSDRCPSSSNNTVTFLSTKSSQ